mmetsp:Transcript_5168/g.10717  ORF Transcript_5168/g.10717 Transcript_5168/m.10717 type:complete len:227 (-) Transcript_5168:246-926(-)|eukprot:CAMPEP_0171499588 /NCGR_PEP_ID=MMETSP0958-20121227/8515_1 /TAXON_ID=87120 /ORGANISM="Aurantiochytrium limacinum, Strain ATCCMYA-1381" /LENGTH=226 /DNA_ID=CAMNT_0012034167 /DNA_START=212 /DNA_END=892 /DNA_ORIENTATION=-
MIRFTYVARVQDGLMLVASIDRGGAAEAPQGQQHQADGKQLIRSLNIRSPKQCTIESENVAFHYLIENSIVYLVLADKAYPKRVAFLFLHEMHAKFMEHVQAEHGPNWEHALATVDRPYAFIQFERQIQRLRKEFADPNSRHTMSKLNSDLQDVTTIMKRNIQDVLDRGDRLNRTYEASSKLMNDSMKFHGGAKKLNRMAFIRKWAPVAIGVLLVIFFLFIRMYLL